MEVKWTYTATKNLKKVYKFYLKTANKQVAKEIINAVFELTQNLESGMPMIGQEEELLKHLNQGHRYLLIYHLKIIYLPTDTYIYITHIFDTRQNPAKLK